MRSFKAEIRELQGEAGKKSADVTIGNGQHIGLTLPDTDEEMISYLLGQQYDATGLDRPALVLKYTSTKLAQLMHTQVKGKYAKTFASEVIQSMKNDITRSKFCGQAKEAWDKFYKSELKAQHFSAEQVRSINYELKEATLYSFINYSFLSRLAQCLTKA